MIFKVSNDDLVFIENISDIAIKYIKQFHVYRNMVFLLF